MMQREGEMGKFKDGFLLAAETLVRDSLERDQSGDDWWHIYRVVQTTKRIAAQEGADGFVCELAALLHDVVDEKLNADPAAAQRELEDWLAGSGTPAAQVEHVLEIWTTMSFKGGARPPMVRPEGQVVQDADRLNADRRGGHLWRIRRFGLERLTDS